MSTVLDKTEGRSKSQEIVEISIDTEEYTTRLELLYEVAQKASSYPEVLKLIGDILSVTQRILRASAASLLIIDEEKGELGFQTADGTTASTIRQIKLDADSGIAGWVALNGSPVIANDVSRNKHFNKDIDEFSGFTAHSIIAVPLLRGQKIIGVLELLNTDDESTFSEQDLAVLTGFASTEALILLVSMAATALHIIRLCQSEDNARKKPAETLAAAAEAKDPYASGHSLRVKEYALLAASSLSFTPEEIQVIEFGALLHDIGKIGIDEGILSKPGSLTDEEWYVMRKHSEIGANIVGEIPFLDKAKNIVLSHHERYDGAGYPECLKGEDIHIGARLVAIADAFDTMTTDHSYRAALSVDEAINELTKGAGTQFCPVAVEAFVSAFNQQREKPEDEEAEPAAVKKAEPEAETINLNDDTRIAEAWRNRGIILGKQKKDEDALKAFVKAVELDSKNAEAWRNKGTALGRLGRDEEALEALKKATELEPKYAAAWRSVGAAFGRLGKDEDALDAFKMAVEIDPRDASAWKNIGIALGKLGRHKEAKKAKETAKQARNEAEREAKERARRDQETEKLAKKEAKRTAEAQAKKELKEAGKASGAEKKVEDEVEHIVVEKTNRDVLETKEIAKDEDAEYAEALRNKGTELVSLGKDEEALEAFMEAIEIDPKYQPRWKRKLKAICGLGRDKKARKVEKFEKPAKKEVEIETESMAQIETVENTYAESEVTYAETANDCSEIYEGDVQLAISASEGFKQINQFKKYLRKVENLNITLNSWSEDKGVIITVSLQKPMLLRDILRQIPIVEQIAKENKHIDVVLKTTAS